MDDASRGSWARSRAMLRQRFALILEGARRGSRRTGLCLTRSVSLSVRRSRRDPPSTAPQTPTTCTSQRRSRSRSSSRKRMRCQVPRHELALAHRHRLACGAEQHRHAVGVAVAELLVLLVDVLRAPVPVVVRVVVLGRDEPLQHHGEVLEEPALPLVDAHRARRVRRVDAADAVLDAALADRVAHLVGDVGHREPARRAQLHLTLERLHGRIPSVGSATGAALVATLCQSGARARAGEPVSARSSGGPVAQLVRAADS